MTGFGKVKSGWDLLVFGRHGDRYIERHGREIGVVNMYHFESYGRISLTVAHDPERPGINGGNGDDIVLLVDVPSEEIIRVVRHEQVAIIIEKLDGNGRCLTSVQQRNGIAMRVGYLAVFLFCYDFAISFKYDTKGIKVVMFA